MIIVILTFDGDLDRAPEVVGPFMDESSRMAWVDAIQPEHPGVEFLLTTTTEPWRPTRPTVVGRTDRVTGRAATVFTPPEDLV